MSGRQPALFDVRTVGPTPCPVAGCGAIRLAGQTGRLPTCMHDLELAKHRPRPKQCVNQYDPATAPWPEGF